MLFSFHRLTCNAGSRVSSPHLFSRFSWNGSTTNEQRHIFFARAVVFFVELWAAGNNITIPVVAEKQRNNYCRLVILERSISLHHLRESREALRVPQVCTNTNFKMLLFVSVHARVLGGNCRPMDRPCTNINSEPDEMTRRSYRSIDANFFNIWSAVALLCCICISTWGPSFLFYALLKGNSVMPSWWWKKNSFFICLLSLVYSRNDKNEPNTRTEAQSSMQSTPLPPAFFPCCASCFKFPSLFFPSLSCPSMGDWVNNGQDL